MDNLATELLQDAKRTNKRMFVLIKMSMLENCSESTINREIKKIKKKIMKVI